MDQLTEELQSFWLALQAGPQESPEAYGILAALLLLSFLICRRIFKVAHLAEGESPEVAPGESGALEQPVQPVAKTLSKGLSKTRAGFLARLRDSLAGGAKIDKSTLAELEAALIACDLGAKMAQEILASVSAKLPDKSALGEPEVLEIIKRDLVVALEEGTKGEIGAHADDIPNVVMLVGVNGVGKTTTAAKLASKVKSRGESVFLVAADTFRAAAQDQLKEWGARIGVPVVSGPENAKPATVVFDAMAKAKSESTQTVIIDTAGRLHTKSNLMQELEGVRNSIEKHLGKDPQEVILVVDGSTGQNALAQAREFHAAVKLTGVIVTKLDGSARGGVVVAIKKELNVPIRYIGIGESSEDLRAFDAEEFVEALFDSDQPAGEESKVSAHAAVRRKRRGPSAA